MINPILESSENNAGKCSRCECLPEPLPEKGTIYVSPPIVHTGQEILSYFSKMGMEYTELYNGIYAAPYSKGQLKELCNEFLGKVSRMELRDTKCLILSEKENLSIHHLTRMLPLQTYVARVKGEWLMSILREDRIYSRFHPIVRADNPGDVYAYECLARGLRSDGAEINPVRMFSVADEADLMFNLDRACRIAAIKGCEKHGIAANIFINFNPSTIYNPTYCLQTTLKAIREAGISPDRIVFEVVESEEVRDPEHLLNILGYYREHGFRVALDDLGAGYSSLNLLGRLRPDFVKLDMELVQGVDEDDYKAVITGNLIKMARNLDVSIVAEGVETVGQWQWLRDRGVDYLQGFLFAKPAAPPEKVVVPE